MGDYILEGKINKFIFKAYKFSVTYMELMWRDLSIKDHLL